MRRLGFFVSALAGLGAIISMPCVIDAQAGPEEQPAQVLSGPANPLFTSAGRRYMAEQPRHWRACMIQR